MLLYVTCFYAYCKVIVVACVVVGSSYVMGWFTVMDPVVEACITSFVNDPTEQQYMALLCNS